VASLARRLRGLALGVVLVLAGMSPAQAQDSVRLAEQDIKAGLLYNFLRYTEWPARSPAPEAMVVCVYGRDPFSGRLTPMSGRTVNRQPIRIRYVEAQREVDGCSMLFVNAEERSDWPDLRAYLARRQVLTVSDYEGFARSGGMIEFTRANNRVGVRVNLGAAQAAQLVVQERLLRLASVVETDQP
jgi:hypothetical protein